MRATAFAVLLALLPPAAAQSGAWADDTAAPGLGGSVFAFTTWQGALYAGGFPFAANGGPIASLARWNGASWGPVGSGVDLLTGWGPFPTPTVLAMCEYQGDLIVAGTFDVAGGQSRNNIARWDGTAFHALGQGVVEIGWNADVRALAVFNNELYATGTFDLAGGQPANGIARWNGATWSPCGSGLAGGNANGVALRVVGNELIVAGDFTSAGGVAARSVARWNGATFAPLGAGLDGQVRALAEFGGQLVAAGAYSFSGATFVDGPAVWNGATWQPLGGPGGGGPTLVTSLQVLGGQLFAGGAFVSPGPYVCRFDGTTWSGFGGVSGVFSGTSGTIVLALGVHGTELLVGGEFTRGGNPPTGVAAVASCNVIAHDGAAWRAMGTGRGVQGTVRRVLPFRGDWLAIGAFDQIGNAVARGIARWDGDAWRPFVDCDGSVEHAVVWNGDLIASGTFTQIGGQPIQGMARWNGTVWSQFGPPILAPLAAHQGQLYAGGTNTLRRWGGTNWVAVAPVNGVIDDMHLHGDGDLYFTTAASSQRGVYRWNGTTATLIGTPNDLPMCLSSFGNDLVVGGRFSSISGAPANLLARWNGTAWSAFGAGVTGYAVESLCELDGKLYAATNGDPRGFLLRWNGAAWQAVPGALDGVPLAMFADAATASLHTFGGFHSAGGKPVWNAAEWREQPRWRNRLHGSLSAGETPLLRGTGTLLPSSPWTYAVHAFPQHVGVLAFGLSRVDAPLFGGTLVPSPDALLVLLGDGSGSSLLASTWPTNAPAGVQVLAQTWLLDATAASGFRATNALECIAP